MLWIVYWILQGQAQNTLLHEVGFLHNPTKYLAFLCTLLVPVSAVLSSTYFHAWLPCFSRSLESDGMSPDVWSPFTTSSLSVGFQLHSLPCSWRLKLWKQVPKLASLVFSEVLPMEETGVRLEDGRRKENISVCSGVLQVARWLMDMGSSSCSDSAVPWWQQWLFPELQQHGVPVLRLPILLPYSITNKNLEHKSHWSSWMHAGRHRANT